MAAAEERTADRRRWERGIILHLSEFPRQYAALETAMAAFGEDFDLEQFKTAFNSREDMEAYNRAQAVERGVGRVQNFVGDLAIAGSRLAGLSLPPLAVGGSRAQQAFEALRSEGVINGEICRRLTRAQRARSMIEHSYIKTPAGDVHRATNLVRETARDFIGPFRAWIAAHLQASAGG